MSASSIIFITTLSTSKSNTVVVPSSIVTFPPSALSTISPEESSVTVVPSSSAVPSAVIWMFAAAAALSVVTIDKVPFVPAVRTTVSSVLPVMVITLPSRAISSTVSAVKVPSEVILLCAAPLPVAAVPEQLPVTFPTTLPVKPALVIVPSELPPSEKVIVPPSASRVILVAASKVIVPSDTTVSAASVGEEIYKPE